MEVQDKLHTDEPIAESNIRYLTGIAQPKTNDGQRERVALLLHAGKILGDAELASFLQGAEKWTDPDRP